MLLGEYQQKLDDKGRFVLPAAFRDELSDTKLILAVGERGELALWPKASFEERVRQKAENEHASDQDHRAFLTFTKNAGEARVDAQFRVAVPEQIRRKIGLGGNGPKALVVIGASNRVEIWEAGLFRTFFGEDPDA